MQCKDIPELPVLRFLASLGRWGTQFEGFDNSVRHAMPSGIPGKLVRAKMGSLIRRSLVDGCVCGCRGDFELTEKGRIYLAGLEASAPEQPADSSTQAQPQA